MKRMITQELIDKIIAFFGNIDIGSAQITIHKLHLQDVSDLLVSDLGSLFPTPSNDKLLAWDNGVLKNVNLFALPTKSVAVSVSEGQGTADLTNETLPFEMIYLTGTFSNISITFGSNIKAIQYDFTQLSTTSTGLVATNDMSLDLEEEYTFVDDQSLDRKSVV